LLSSVWSDPRPGSAPADTFADRGRHCNGGRPETWYLHPFRRSPVRRRRPEAVRSRGVLPSAQLVSPGALVETSPGIATVPGLAVVLWLPSFAEHLDRMERALLAASHIRCGAVPITSPADPLRMPGLKWVPHETTVPVVWPA